MKNILLLFAICFTFFIFPKITYSISPTSIPTATPTIPPLPEGITGGKLMIPGKDCGDWTNTDALIRRCCYNQPITAPSMDLIPKPDFLPDFLNFPFQFINNAAKSSAKKLNLDQIQSYAVPCINGSPSDPSDPNCVCEEPEEAKLSALEPLCDNISDKTEQGNCLKCLKGEGEGDLQGKVGVWTGVGCIYANTQSFIEETVFKWGIGLAGTIALLCIIYSAFQIQISQGNPEKLKKAQEMLTSCIIGLMLLIFSVFILKVIGVDILKIPFDIFL